jgi:hypothetical protein
MRRGRLTTLVIVAHLIVGAFIAVNHDYFSDTHGWKGIASAVIAILLWPLVVAGVNLHLK